MQQNLNHGSTLTVIFPPWYLSSSCGSRAGRRENSKPSMSFQSSAWPSRVMMPGLNWASTWISEADSQLHSPESLCEPTLPIDAELKKNTSTNNRCRSIVRGRSLGIELEVCLFWLLCFGPHHVGSFNLLLIQRCPAARYDFDKQTHSVVVFAFPNTRNKAVDF